jgi:hypothetical protein
VEVLQKPNKQDYFGKMLYRLHQQKALTGSAKLWMVPNKLGTPCELYIIPTAMAVPQPVVNPEFPHGYYRIMPLYPYGPFSSYPTPYSAAGAPIPAEWIINFQYPHPLLRYDGYSPLTGMRLTIDGIEMIERSQHYSMRRSINPSAVLNMKEVEGMQNWIEQELERVRAEFEAAHQGPENHGNLFCAPPGGVLEPWGNKPTEMDYQSSWEQKSSYILGGGFGITKPAAGMVEESSYSNLYAALKQLNLLTLDPECNDIGQELTRNLAPFYGDDLIVEVRTKPINDNEIKMGRLQFLSGVKALTKNEARKECEFPTTEEEWGDDICGDPSPKEEEKEQQAQQQQGAGGPLGGGGEGLSPGALEPEAEEEREEPEEVTQTRPTPGPLGEGALGPRKSLNLAKMFPRRVGFHRSNGHNRLNGKAKSLIPVGEPDYYSLMTEGLSDGV